MIIKPIIRGSNYKAKFKRDKNKVIRIRELTLFKQSRAANWHKKLCKLETN